MSVHCFNAPSVSLLLTTYTRIPTLDIMNKHMTAWENDRNNRQPKINWHFSTSDARTRLRHIYPNL